MPSGLPPRKRTRTTVPSPSPPPNPARVIPEGAFGPPRLPISFPNLSTFARFLPSPPAAPVVPSRASSSEVEIIENPTPAPLPRISPVRPTRAARKPRAKAKAADKNKGKTPGVRFVRIRPAEPIYPSVPDQVDLDTMLPTVYSPPYPCVQCAYHGNGPCVFQGWERACDPCKSKHLKCSYVVKNNADLHQVRERLHEQVRASPSGESFCLHFSFLLSNLLFLGLVDLFENLARNTRLLDDLQRSVNLLLSDRGRLLNQMHSIIDGVGVEAPGALTRLFGDEAHLAEFFDFDESINSLMPRDRFHLDLPPRVDYPFDASVPGPSGTQANEDDDEMSVEDGAEGAQGGDGSGEVQG